MPTTPINGSTAFPATPNAFLNAVETIASQRVKAVVSTNSIEDAFFEYQVENGKVIEEAIIAMAQRQAFVPTASGAQPDLSPLDPTLYIRYFNNFEESQFKTTKREDEIASVMVAGKNPDDVGAEIVDTLTAGEGDYDYSQMRAIIEDVTTPVGVDASTALFNGGVPQSAKGIMYAMRKMFNAVKGTNTIGLPQGVSTKQGVPVEDIRIAISEDVLALIDMVELASLFNLSKEEIYGKIVRLPHDPNYAGNIIRVYDRKSMGRATKVFAYAMENFPTRRYSNHTLTTSRAYFYNGLFKNLYLDVSTAVTSEIGKLIA